MVVDRLAERNGISLKRKGHQGLYGVGSLAGQEVTLLLPQTFMNRSGASVASAYQSLGVEPGDLAVIHDDIDLDFGCIKVKSGGGHGGHNGLRNIHAVLGEREFCRLRMGVGRPHGGGDVSGYVLNRFSSIERSQLNDYIAIGVEALECLLRDGVEDAMNRYNNRDWKV
jgi:PTH1 family peptidyl-tRNA hydrolase